MAINSSLKNHKVIVLVDGSNFYHRAREIGIRTSWQFNYRRFAEWLAEGRPIGECVYYTGVISKRPNDIKSQQLVSDQQRLFAYLESPAQGFQIFRGHVMKQPGQYKEKGVDVKLAVDLVLKAVKNYFDTAILVSSDTDLIPAIAAIHEFGKRVEYVGFSHQPSFGLIKATADRRLLRRQDLQQFISSASGEGSRAA